MKLRSGWLANIVIISYLVLDYVGYFLARYISRMLSGPVLYLGVEMLMLVVFGKLYIVEFSEKRRMRPRVFCLDIVSSRWVG